MIDVIQLDDGTCIAAEHGTWIEGCYTTEDAARLAVTVDPNKLHVLWETALNEGREALTLEEVQGAVQ